MKALVVNDIHLFSKYQDDSEAQQKLDALDPHNPQAAGVAVIVLNGDISDCSACAKKDVPKARNYQRSIINKWGDFYIRGNHDLIPNHRANLKIGKTLFTHGHLLGDKKRVAKWVKYENKEAGAGRLKLIWVDVADDMDWIKGKRPLPEDIIEAAVDLALKMGCTEVILGHYHPLVELKYVRRGVTVRCLPKGFNYIDIVGTDG